MEPVFDLAVVDAEGAVREHEERVAGDTRAAFFRKAAIGGGTLLGSGAIMGMLPELAIAKPSKRQDLAILNYALTLEYLEAAFYAEAVSNGAALGEPALTLAKTIGSHETAHVKALRTTIRSLGGKAVAKPTFDFQGTTASKDKFLATAFVLENTGVQAYLGQAGNLKSKALLGAAASIVTVEARHAAAVATLSASTPYVPGPNGITPNGGFDKAASKAKILAEVGKTGFIKG